MVTQVTKHDGYVTVVTEWSPMSQSYITQLHDTKKDVEGSRIDDVVQYGNSMLALWGTHILEGRLVIVCAQTMVCSI